MNKRITLGFKIVAALLTGCFFMAACENKISDLPGMAGKAVGIEEAKNIESYLSQDGKMKAKLMAPLMLRYQRDTPRVEFPKTLRVDFFDSTLKIESKLFAKYGHYLENDNKVFLQDSVVVYNVKGDTLFCKELYWDQQRAIFYTDKDVIIHKPDQKIYGRGLSADQAFKWFTIVKVYDSYMDVPDSTAVF